MKNMKKIILILSVILLGGCSTQSQINDEIITETKKCEENGLEAQPLTTMNGMVNSIQCLPKK
jgi:hypothetical protein